MLPPRISTGTNPSISSAGSLSNLSNFPIPAQSRLGTTPNQSKGPRQKESQFLYKYGQKHHSYDAEKAPYPVSYNPAVLELCVRCELGKTEIWVT